MTTQQALNQIVEYFSKSDAKLARVMVIGDAADCVYRTSDGRGCAVGCLIPAELYHSEFEDKSCRMFDDILFQNRVGLSQEAMALARKVGQYLQGVDYQFLIEAQHAHDGAPTVSAFLNSLRRVVEDHDLRWPS